MLRNDITTTNNIREGALYIINITCLIHKAEADDDGFIYLLYASLSHAAASPSRLPLHFHGAQIL